MTFCQRFSFRSLVIYNLDSKEQKFPKNTKMCMMMFIYLFFFKILNLNCETISSNIVIIYLLTKLRILKKNLIPYTKIGIIHQFLMCLLIVQKNLRHNCLCVLLGL